MTEALKPSEVLSRAADLIEPEGKWFQGGYGHPSDEDGNEYLCLCTWGAVDQASGMDYHVAKPALDLLAETIGTLRIADWNDTPGRTQAEVVAALRKASELAKAEGQ